MNKLPPDISSSKLASEFDSSYFIHNGQGEAKDYKGTYADILEDFPFLELAKSKGFDTHVFTDVKLSHLGGLKVKSDGTVTTTDM